METNISILRQNLGTAPPATVYIRDPTKGYIQPAYKHSPTVSEGGSTQAKTFKVPARLLALRRHPRAPKESHCNAFRGTFEEGYRGHIGMWGYIGIYRDI